MSLYYAILSKSVTSIESGAFQSCTNLTSVTMPNSLTNISAEAFEGCTSLVNVTIPKSVTSIGDYAFSGCTSLTAFTVDPQDSAYSSLNGVLFDKAQTTLILYPPGKTGDYVITNGTTTIGTIAFAGCPSLTSVTIPSSVINIGTGAFASCHSLTAITVESLNLVYSSVGGILFNKSKTTLIQYPGGKTGTYSIPSSVTSVGDDAFAGCGLTSVTIPNSVTSINVLAFENCTSLMGVFFEGDAPAFDLKNDAPGFPLPPFFGDKATIYYLPGTAGWSTNFAGRPTAPWKPQVQTDEVSFGVRSNQFGFNIIWASGVVIVVEATTNLAKPNWSAQATNTLTNGSLYFSDPQWTNYPIRLYRIRSP